VSPPKCSAGQRSPAEHTGLIDQLDPGGTVVAMTTRRPPGSIVSSHIDAGIDPSFAKSLVDAAAEHLGSAIHVLHRVAWDSKSDSENWSVLAMVVTGSFAAVVEHRVASGQTSRSLQVFPLSNVLLYGDLANSPFAVLAPKGDQVRLPAGTRASDLYTVR